MTHQEMQLCDTINQLREQLKAQLARMKEWRDTFERVGNSLTAERDAARDERDALLKDAERTPMDRFENAIREVGVVAACEWFGHGADSEFTKETIRVLDERAAMASSSKEGK